MNIGMSLRLQMALRNSNPRIMHLRRAFAESRSQLHDGKMCYILSWTAGLCSVISVLASAHCVGHPKWKSGAVDLL